MIWLYVGWRVLRLVRPLVLAAAVIAVVLIAHPQRQLERSLTGHGLIAAEMQRLEHQLQHGRQQHLRPLDKPGVHHPQTVERRGNR